MLESEPLDRVGFHSLSSELHGGPLGVQVGHCVVPHLSRVGIDFPAVSVLGGGPVGHSEALEEGSGSSEEVDISDSLEECVGVEVLSVHVELDVGFLVELVHIEVFNSDSYIILN